jgi:N-acetylglutamate synthase-like GNAT family acetyltransferase
MKARKARSSDAEAIYRLISHYTAEGLLLPRAEEEIRRNITHFLVCEEKRLIVGCVALESYTADLAEIRSLAVDPQLRGRGLGARLIGAALDEARCRGTARVFAVTHAPEFFVRHGFTAGSRRSLTEKIERDCRACPKQRSCRLVAVIATVIPEGAALPVLSDSAIPVSAA